MSPSLVLKPSRIASGEWVLEPNQVGVSGLSHSNRGPNGSVCRQGSSGKKTLKQDQGEKSGGGSPVERGLEDTGWIFPWADPE